MRLIFYVLLTILVTTKTHAEVLKSSVDGFIIQHNTTVSGDVSDVFPEMTAKLGSWWSPDHSFSGDAGAMSVDENCFCERWGNNLVRHLDTTLWIENDKVVMQGGLGPLKELGLNGTMAWSLTPGEGSDTNIAWKYHVYGYSETDLVGLSVAVDGVLKEQIERLASHLGRTGQVAKSE